MGRPHLEQPVAYTGEHRNSLGPLSFSREWQRGGPVHKGRQELGVLVCAALLRAGQASEFLFPVFFEQGGSGQDAWKHGAGREQTTLVHSSLSSARETAFIIRQVSLLPSFPPLDSYRMPSPGTSYCAKSRSIEG